jgi:hypothetical protein
VWPICTSSLCTPKKIIKQEMRQMVSRSFSFHSELTQKPTDSLEGIALFASFKKIDLGPIAIGLLVETLGSAHQYFCSVEVCLLEANLLPRT